MYQVKGGWLIRYGYNQFKSKHTADVEISMLIPDSSLFTLAGIWDKHGKSQELMSNTTKPTQMGSIHHDAIVL